MRLAITGLVLAAAMALPLAAFEDFRMPGSLDRLAQRASESVDVTLDASMLQLASGFLSKDDPDQVRVKKLVSKLKGVYVRNFQFEREGQYSAGDVQAARDQVRGSGWTRIVGVKSLKGDNAEIYLKKDGNQIAGLVVIAAEPKELTMVYIDGPIDPEELSELGGHLGVPKFGDKGMGEKDKGAKPGKNDE